MPALLAFKVRRPKLVKGRSPLMASAWSATSLFDKGFIISRPLNGFALSQEVASSAGRGSPRPSTTALTILFLRAAPATGELKPCSVKESARLTTALFRCAIRLAAWSSKFSASSNLPSAFRPLARLTYLCVCSVSDRRKIRHF